MNFRTLLMFLLLAPSAALAAAKCEAPKEVNLQNPPPVSEKTANLKLGGDNIAVVPYSLGANFIEYHVWKMDAACKASEVSVYSFGTDGNLTRYGALACMGMRPGSTDDSIRCMQQSGASSEYLYEDGALREQQSSSSVRQDKRQATRAARAAQNKKKKDTIVVYTTQKVKMR